MDDNILLILIAGVYLMTILLGLVNAHLNDKLRMRVKELENYLEIDR